MSDKVLNEFDKALLWDASETGRFFVVDREAVPADRQRSITNCDSP